VSKGRFFTRYIIVSVAAVFSVAAFVAFAHLHLRPVRKFMIYLDFDV
jgi:hypothetical protein